LTVHERSCLFCEVVAYGDEAGLRLAPLGQHFLQILGCDYVALSGFECN
jgi:hypothetical protein